MKSIFRRILMVLSIGLFSISATCQNGPSPAPTTVLSWTQGANNGTTITANCVYRGTVAGIYTLPALYCSSTPITTYTDTTVVAGVTYHYAVTAKAGTLESAYSNDATAVIPTMPGAPVLGTPIETFKKINKVPIMLDARVQWVPIN